MAGAWARRAATGSGDEAGPSEAPPQPPAGAGTGTGSGAPAPLPRARALEAVLAARAELAAVVDFVDLLDTSMTRQPERVAALGEHRARLDITKVTPQRKSVAAYTADLVVAAAEKAREVEAASTILRRAASAAEVARTGDLRFFADLRRLRRVWNLRAVPGGGVAAHVGGCLLRGDGGPTDGGLLVPLERGAEGTVRACVDVGGSGGAGGGAAPPRVAEGVEAVHALLRAHQRAIFFRRLGSCTQQLPAELAECALAARTLAARAPGALQAPEEILLQGLLVRNLVQGAGRESDFRPEARLWLAAARHRALAGRVAKGLLRRIGEGPWEVPCLVRWLPHTERPGVTGAHLLCGRGAGAMRLLCVLRGTAIAVEGVEGTRGALSVDQQGLDALVLSALKSLSQAQRGGEVPGDSDPCPPG